jgi:hypothetical protein
MQTSIQIGQVFSTPTAKFTVKSIKAAPVTTGKKTKKQLAHDVLNDVIATYIMAIAEASKEALKYTEHHDGGTCNFDQCTLDLSGWKRSAITQLINQAGKVIGGRIEYAKYFKGCYYLNTPLHGQGMRRTKMAYAAYDYLKNAGIPVRMYLQAD